MHCPSCGSVIDETETTCPVCGEDLAATDNTTPESTTPATPGRTTTERSVPERGASIPPLAAAESVSSNPARITCPECGAANARSATECSVCGASLEGADKPVRRTAAATGADGKGTLQTYLIAGLAMVVIALVIYIATGPSQQAGPAQATAPGAPSGEGAEGQGALPPNHPPVDQSAQMEALNKLVADLETKVKADPTNDSLQLALANALYDVGKHPDAKGHYEVYLKKHPENLDVATDFATSVAATGKVDSAVTVLNNVLRKDPKHQRAAFNMAIMYRQKENRDSIIYWLERVAAIDSTTPTGKGALDILREFKSGHPVGGTM
jgi:cytochrome c-type biogenesis protein CcmH/NrfG